ncbi:MAG: 2-amino-4-hydroxy-6-hydroxymethyldihydropteridine diphosphokinase [Chloroflexota bacterium]
MTLPVQTDWPIAPPITIYLGLGANLGDREANLSHALALLAPQCGPFVCSSIYEAPPWGDVDQPPFLNLVARGQTRLALPALLDHVQAVERRVGRTPGRRWGPRVVDVDILAYGKAVIAEPGIEVPHPRLHERGFVLVPLAELSPDWRHPRLGNSAADLLAALPPEETTGIRRWGAPLAPDARTVE